MDEAELLQEALGATGRRISRDPFGSGVIAGFEVDDDGTQLTYFVDTSGQDVPEETGMVLRSDDDGSVVARIWLHPADPRLPSLKVAAFGESAAQLLARQGVEGAFESQMVAYRPGKRAVLRLRGEHETLYLKVVPPARAAHIADLHRALLTAGVPVPAVRSWSPDGLLLIEEAQGTPGPEAAVEMHADALLDAVDLARLAFARADIDDRARPSLASRASWYATRLEQALPDEADRIGGLRQAIARQVREVTLPDVVHGDLHLGQLFLRDGAVSGLIDVDTAGVGDVADDSAAFIAHARTSALLNGEAGRQDAADALHALADAASERWLDSAHALALTAMHLLAHGLSAAEAGALDRARTMVADAERLVAR